MKAPLVAPEPTGTSRAGAFYNMLCFTVGAGMLGLPHALLFSKSFFLIPVVFGGLLCFHTASLLYQTQVHFGVTSYQSLGGACGGKGLQRLVATTLSINQVGIGVLYMITVCRNAEMLMEGNENQPRWWLYPVLAAVTFAASSQGESIAHISGMSSLGLLSVIAVGLLVVAAAGQEEPNAGQCSEVSVPDALAGLGTAIFAFGGHPVYPDVQGSMNVPRDFNSVLRSAFILMTALFIMVNFSAWQAFGYSLQGYVLDDLKSSGWRKAAIVGMTVHLVAAIPIVLLPMMRVVESYIQVNFQVVRSGIVSMTAIVAYMFPFFSDFLALLGGLTENLLVFFFPVAFYYLAFGRQRGGMGLVFAAVHLLTVALASAILVLGTKSSLSNIAAKWEQYCVRWWST